MNKLILHISITCSERPNNRSRFIKLPNPTLTPFYNLFLISWTACKLRCKAIRKLLSLLTFQTLICTISLFFTIVGEKLKPVMTSLTAASIHFLSIAIIKMIQQLFMFLCNLCIPFVRCNQSQKQNRKLFIKIHAIVASNGTICSQANHLLI